MTDTTAADKGGNPDNPDTSSDPSPTTNPAAPIECFVLGIYFCVLAGVTFYVLVATWPVPAAPPKDGFETFSLFGVRGLSLPVDLRLFLTVIAAGALGSLVHAITSFADYVGNRKLSRNWIWWFILRTPIGIALALLFYVVLRGGLLVPTLPSGGGGSVNTTQLVNPYGVAAMSALAGMFAKQATDKLREVFDTVFRTREPVKRDDPLNAVKPAITGVTPPKLAVSTGPAVVEIAGSGFRDKSTATVNGEPRKLEWVSATKAKLTLEPKDYAAAGKLTLVISNPDPNGGKTDVYTIDVA